MSVTLASMIGQPGIVFFGLGVMLWAYLRPPMIRDDDGRALPPNLTVRVFIIVLYLFAYNVLVGTAASGGDAFARWANDALLRNNWLTGSVMPKISGLSSNAPGLAFAILLVPTMFRPARELERRFLIWCFGGSHLSQDARVLAHHLAGCSFQPSKEERQRSVEGLRDFNVFLTDTQTSSIQLVSVDLWRKVNTLLHLVKEWNPPARMALSELQRRQLAQMENSHRRKTKLAMEIVSLVAQKDDPTKTLSEVSDILAGTPHGDVRRSAMNEEQIAVLIGSAELKTDRPTRLASKDLEDYLKPINDYFAVEYQLLLEDVCRIAAKTLVHAGDLAPGRLKQLKDAGFSGLGRVERMDMARLFIVLVTVAASGFVVLQMLPQPGNPAADPEAARQLAQGRPVMLFFISLIMAVAALIGAFTGSSAKLARHMPTPWGRYSLAGLAGVLAFFAIHGAQFAWFGDPMARTRAQQELAVREVAKRAPALTKDERRAVAEQAVEQGKVTRSLPLRRSSDQPPSLLRVAPFSLLPFFIIVGMCRLARVRSWQPADVALSERAANVSERLIDGLVMAAVLITATMLAFSVADAMGMMPVRNAAAPPRTFLMVPFALLGFVIGAFVVRDVRHAAHTQIVAMGQSARPDAGTPPSVLKSAVDATRAAGMSAGV